MLRPRWGLLFCAGALALIAYALAMRSRWGLSNAGWLESGAWSATLDLSVVILGAVSLLMLGAALTLPRRQPGGWSEELSLYRSHSALCRENPRPEALRSLFAVMSDDAVRVAANLPDHSSAGRAAAAAELKQRNASATAPPAPSVPSFFGPEQLPRASDIVFGAGARMRSIVAALSVSGFAIAVGLLVWNYFGAQQLHAQALSAGISPSVLATFDGNPAVTDVPPELATFSEAHAIVFRTHLALIACGVWLFSWVLLKLAEWFRAYPVRVLLLRKFNERRLGVFYKRLLREELQPLGHVVALADKHVRRTMGSWLAHQFYVATSSFGGAIWVALTFPVVLVLRLFDRTRWGPAFVTTARDFRLLARRLYDRMELNVEASSVARAYLIRTSDAWWKLVADVLLRSADVIVLDLSNVTQGTAWEIETIGRLNLWSRVTCIAHADSVASATNLSDMFSANGATPFPNIFAYNSEGSITDRAAFREHLINALRASVQTRFAGHAAKQAHSVLPPATQLSEQ